MRKLLTIGLFLLYPLLLLGQISGVPTTYEHVPKRISVRHISGNPLTSAATVPSLVDTLQLILVDGTVTDTVTIAAIVNSIIRFSISSRSPRTTAYVYTDTLREGQSHVVPAGVRSGNSTSNIQDSVITFVLAANADPGEHFTIELSELVNSDSLMAD